MVVNELAALEGQGLLAQQGLLGRQELLVGRRLVQNRAFRCSSVLLPLALTQLHRRLSLVVRHAQLRPYVRSASTLLQDVLPWPVHRLVVVVAQI